MQYKLTITRRNAWSQDRDEVYYFQTKPKRKRGWFHITYADNHTSVRLERTGEITREYLQECEEIVNPA